MVLAYIFRRQRVTLDVMFAAVTVYLLIAFSFATIYNIALQLDPRSVRFPEWIDPGPRRGPAHGDALLQSGHPRYPGLWQRGTSAPFTQMLAVLEAVIGQLFMAVFVAWLVGMFIYDNFAGER